MSGMHKSAGGACKAALIVFAILSVGLPVAASAADGSAQEPGAQSPTERHIEQAQPPEPAGHRAEIEGLLVGTVQAASDAHVSGQRVEPEANGQLFLYGTLPMGAGAWNLELRAGTTPRKNGVTAFYGEVNDAVGETLNGNGDGRIAATQLFYGLTVAS